MVRLGAGGLDGRSADRHGMDAALQALSKFRRLAESHRVDEIIAAATSAMREAENGGEFLATVQQRDRHPRPRHLRHRGSAADSPRRGLRRRHRARQGRRHRHRRRQHRNHARHGDAVAARQELQDRRHSPDRAIRQERSADRARRAAAGAPHHAGRSATTRSRLPQARLRARDRHVGHDPQPRRRCRARDAGEARRRNAQPARVAPRPSTGCARRLTSLSLGGAAARSRASIRAAPTSRSPAPCCSTRVLRSLGADEITLCDLALREGLVLDYIQPAPQATSHAPTATRTCAGAA